jgi:hypothetical protein
MQSWGKSRTCRASVIRDILRGRLAAEPDPHGLRLRGAKITGRLDLENLVTDVNLELGDCFLEEGIIAQDARLASLVLTRCRLQHPAEPPLSADRLTTSVLILSMTKIIGHASAGAVHLIGARIGGDIDCEGAALRNDSGPALVADRLQVGQSMSLRGGFTATGASDLGAVRLVGARIDGFLECDGASLRNSSGPALGADGLQVGDSLYLRGGFTATGASDLGAVRLVGARIGGDLDCTGAALHNHSGPALEAYGLQVGQGIALLQGFTATGGGAEVTVDLSGARVGGTLDFDPARLEHETDPHGRLAVDGLTYAKVPQPVAAREWLDLLRNGTPSYAAQPYQQLAAGYRALGDERQAREILMAQRDDELARADPRWTERLWGRITKITLGYGYQPWRALLFLGGVVVLSCVLAVALGAHGALTQTSKAAVPGQPCTVVQQVSVGLDLNLPVGTSVARAQCDLTTDSGSVTGVWLTAAGWVLRVLAWVFAALFIAGFTSAVRKTCPWCRSPGFCLAAAVPGGQEFTLMWQVELR